MVGCLSGLLLPFIQATYTRMPLSAAHRNIASIMAVIQPMESGTPDPDPDLPDAAGENGGANDVAKYDGAPAGPPVVSGSGQYPAGSDGGSSLIWPPAAQTASPPVAPSGMEAPALDPEVVEVTLDVLYQVLSEVEEDTSQIASSAAYVADLRPQDSPPEVLTGLKALVTSIFGAYAPVMTTSVVTQTVGNDTYQYLVETVAPGTAGVDYEWLAGVLLFAILLYCLMRLLGGILK